LLANRPIQAVDGPSVQLFLHIRLLGSPEVSFQGQPLTLARRQSRALLYRLAAAPRPVPRDELCFLFWPDTADAVARRNLTVLLNHLRRELPQADLITSAEDALALARPAVWTDVLAFAAGEGHGDDLHQLVSLYRGPFLHGFTLPASPEFAAWVAQEALVWERHYLELLAALVEQQSSQGDYGAAIVNAQHYLAIDELAEEMHRRLIWLFAANGDRAAALRQFDRCATLLEQELDVTPLPVTWALYESIRDGTLQIEPVRDQQRPTPVVDPPLPSESLLPRPQSPLIGREAELAAADERLQAPHVRLLTFVGPGGSGKTRLALELAHKVQPYFAHGVRFVSLAALHDPALVLEAIARACGLHTTARLNDASPLAAAPGASLTSQLRDHLRDKELLLVLDNFEHLLAAGASVAGLLTFAPHVRLLITSRAPLHLSGEHLLPVLPLPLPDLADLPAPEQLAHQPAVALLVARAQALLPGFQLSPANAAALAAICVRLDGLPLAIELAAARLRLLSPQALLQRLDHRLTLLTNGPSDLPARQQTLWATIDWSYGLLAPHEQRIFQRLALFAGGWTLEAAEAIVADQEPSSDALSAQRVLDGLATLVDQSLIRQEPGEGEPRFSLLATIREYALHQLAESGEAAHICQRHARYYLGLAEAADLHSHPTAREAWLTRLAQEHDNLRAALAWSLADGAQPATDWARVEIGVRLAATLGPLWYLHGHLSEGREWLTQALAAADHAPIAPLLRMRALAWAARLACAQGDYEVARTQAQASFDLAQTLDDAQGSVDSSSILGDIAQTQGDYDQAQLCYQRSLTISQRQQDQRGIALALRNLGSIALVRGQLDEARTLFEESQSRFYALGDRWGIAQVFYSLGEVAHHRGEYPVAAQHYGHSVALYRAMDNRWSTAWLLNKLGEVAHYAGDNERAIELYQESLTLFRKLGHREGIALALHNLSYERFLQGEYAQAWALHQESFQLFQQSGVKWGVGVTLSLLGVLALAQGDWVQARRRQEQSLAIWQALGTKRGIVLALTRLGIVAHVQREYTRAMALQRQCFLLAWEADDRLGMALGLEGLAAALVAQEQFERGARFLGAARALRTSMRAPRRQQESTQVEQALAALCARLETPSVKAAWEQGRTLPLAHRVAELQWLTHPVVGAVAQRLHPIRPFALVSADGSTDAPEPIWPLGANQPFAQEYLPLPEASVPLGAN
jgi:predicted ATPase/DNA-binding SARP family transcriptional activator